MELSDKNRTQFLERFIPGFTDPDGFCFFGARRFSSKGISFLISGQTGGTILLTDQLAENIVQGKTSGDLKFKLIQRGLGKIYNSREAVTAKEQPLPCCRPLSQFAPRRLQSKPPLHRRNPRECFPRWERS